MNYQLSCKKVHQLCPKRVTIKLFSHYLLCHQFTAELMSNINNALVNMSSYTFALNIIPISLKKKMLQSFLLKPWKESFKHDCHLMLTSNINVCIFTLLNLAGDKFTNSMQNSSKTQRSLQKCMK